MARFMRATSTNLRNWTAPTSVINSAGYHFNDPSVIAVSYPAGSPSARLVYLMYLTGCTTVTDCYTTGHNVTYGATSYDGVTWSTPQLVIGINNGLNNGGAWSPSAVKISESLVYLYFFVNTNDPATDGSVQRATINPQVDFFRATSPIRVVLPYHVNPDVLNLRRRLLVSGNQRCSQLSRPDRACLSRARVPTAVLALFRMGDRTGRRSNRHQRLALAKAVRINRDLGFFRTVASGSKRPTFYALMGSGPGDGAG